MQSLTLRTYCAGVVTGAFLVLLSSSIASSGSKGNGGIAGACPADIAPAGGNGIVDVDDLLMVINAWGSCDQGNTDEDGDGWTPNQGDCNDGDPEVNPDAAELCNNIDDDCNGLIDDGIGSADAQEPNNTCAASTNLGSIEKGRTIALTGTLYPAGDIDNLRYFAIESNGGFEDPLVANITLTVPSGSSSSFLLCARFDGCGQGSQPCISLAPGATDTLTLEWDDEFGQDDSRHILIEIRQLSPADGECQNYQLSIDAEG